MAMIEIDRNPPPRTLRQFAGLFLIAFGALGYLLLRRTGSVELAAVVWSVALLVCAVGLAWPARIRRVYVGLVYLAFPIGWVVSHVVLALVLYLLLTPIGWILRLAGHNALERRFDREAASYWTERKPVDRMDRYFRQF